MPGWAWTPFQLRSSPPLLVYWDGLQSPLQLWGQELGAPGSHSALKESRSVVLWARKPRGSGQLNGEHTGWLRLGESVAAVNSITLYKWKEASTHPLLGWPCQVSPGAHWARRSQHDCFLSLSSQDTNLALLCRAGQKHWGSSWHPFVVIFLGMRFHCFPDHSIPVSPFG